MRKLFTLIAFLMALSVAADTPKYLTIKAGSQLKSYSISDIRKITFGKQTADAVEVHPKSSKVDTYSYSIFEKGVFEVTPSESGVESVSIVNSDISILYKSDANQVEISSSQEIVSVQIYSINGRLVTNITPMYNETTVSLAEYAAGVYVVKAMTSSSSQIQKVVKR